jgi:ATP-dependent helicase/nuclease subunit A
MDSWALPDEGARRRIETDLDTNLLVEAGAGSGKTHAMVGRMLALIGTGTAAVDEIAAVTFTRKAAGELRERFQIRLEQAHAASLAACDAAGSDRFRAALAGIDRCFIGTIHAFCGRLLRERPLDAGISPEFQEISGPEEDRFRAECWTRFLERLTSDGDRLLDDLAAVGVRPSQLQGLFREIAGNPDVRFPVDEVPFPDAAEVERWRRTLGALLGDTLALMPEDEPAGGWDALQNLARTLRRTRLYPGWQSDPGFLDALAEAVGKGHKPTYNRWAVEKATVKELEARWDDLAAEDGAACSLVRRWHAHRYPVLLGFARAAADFYAEERIRTGRLDFQDLLLLTARLLRTSADAREELGTRYRRLLVDEFQDTDPVQAEVLLLLGAEDAAGGDWTRAVPRPGALFVVGDPKQSIYRFRRADISVYNQVKTRFRAFGDVLNLVANFRSTSPIERIVQRVFDDDSRFPREETPHQAPFAPLATDPTRAVGGAGIFFYGFETPGRGQFLGKRVSDPDCAALASWVAAEVTPAERGGRGESPGSFMVLTRTKSELATYAAALESRGVPVQVSGAGVGMEEELQDLVLLLRALIDPSDGILTVAVLEGLFFGLSHADLFEHVRLGGRFDGARAEHPAGSPAAAALKRLNRFWRLTRRLPADAAVAAIVEELGILPHAVAGELGATRAGALLYALDALRSAALDGECSLPGAVEVLMMALEQEVDTPLDPGRTDAVRLMNLHKAKGLEADTVILAYPAKPKKFAPTRHVTRGADGSAVGYLVIQDDSRRGGAVLARPLEWEAHEAAEQLFRDAEDTRLLYVAVTRAARRLVVARCDGTREGSVWDGLHEALDEGLATALQIRPVHPVERPPLEDGPERIRVRVADAENARAAARRPTYRSAPVTSRVRKDGGGSAHAPEPRDPHPGEVRPEPRGADWGRAVHRALEVATLGAEGDSLRRACRDILLDEERPVDSRGEPTELDDLVSLVERVLRSPLWQRASAAAELLVEVPFTLAMPRSEAVALGFAADAEGPDAPATDVIDGVIDLAFREPGGWVIADYKSDAEPSAKAMAAYRAQVAAYAACWERITGEGVTERVILYTARDGEEDRW